MQIVWEKNTENIDFIENGNFIRENAEGAVRGCSGINPQKTTRGGGLL